MIELEILKYLGECLDVPVFVEEPEEQPGEYVLVEKTAGGKKNHICTATLAIQSYAESMVGAMELNEKVKTAMDNAGILTVIGKSELNSDYNFTDTETNRYRYQAVYNLVHY